MTDVKFERFVGIDWSGSKGRYHKSIQIVEYCWGDIRPKVLRPKDGNYWSRSAVVEYIESLRTRPTTLVGIDFAFSIPTPYPNPDLSYVRELWSLVDDICVAMLDDDVREYYAGPVWSSEASPFRPYFRYPGHRGDLFDGKRLRRTEKATTPRATSVYKLMYSQVGRGSFAGMRVLKSLSPSADCGIAVWPFDKIDRSKIVIVEIYPSAFYPMVQCRRPNPEKQTREAVEEVIARVVQHFGVGRPEPELSTQDEIDAYVTAAALSHFSKDASNFSVPRHLQAAASQEGWIFGITGGERP